jgi:quercetin dioxygenase-like cupin family protein
MSNIKKDDNQLIKSAVFNLKELTQYVPQSIISRILLKNDAGNITLFSFAKGQDLSKHSAPFDAFVAVLDGQMTVTIDETANTVKTGEVIIMPANIPHAVYADTDAKMMLVMLKG